MTLIPITLFLTFLVNSFFGVYVFIFGRKNLIRQAFSLMVFGFTGWNLSILTVIFIEPAWIWVYLAFAFGALMILGFALFTINFIYEKSRHLSLINYILSISGAFFSFSSFSPWLIKSFIIKNGFITGEFGPLYPFWSIWAGILIFSSLFLLIFKFFRFSGQKRAQLKYIFFGLALTFIPLISTNLFLPQLFGIFDYNALGPLFTLFFVGFTSYAIARYHLFDINWVIKRVVLFSFLVLSVILVFIFLVSTLTIIIPGIASIVLASIIITFSFEPLKHSLDNVLDRVVFRGEYNYKKTTEELISIWSSTLGLDKLLKSILEKTGRLMNIEKGAFAILIKQGHFIPKQVIGLNSEDFTLTQENYLVKAFSENPEKAIDRSELEYLISLGNSELKIQYLKHELEKLNFVLAIGLAVRGKIIGILFLGKKKDQAAFTVQDLQLLGIISREASSAIEKARLFYEAKFLDQAQYEFIKIVSSQFRSQLAQVRWQSEFLKESLKKDALPTPDDRKSTEEIFEHTMILINVLNNIFDALSIDSSEVKIEKIRGKISEVVKETADKMKKQFEYKKLGFNVVIKNGAEKEIYFDPIKIKRVVEVLLENTLRYTPKGNVEIDIRETEIDGRPMIQVSVVDTGIGVLEEDFSRIFNKFYRAQNAILTHPEGVGLGLYIAKHFIELHQGKIWAESEGEMKGSVFYFILPIL
ncbi:MAG: hypothetical protein HYV52_03280 [Parcubacteria group bacterium]|nr:hypothetical protein [Parcubacteria group bacterium]